MRCGPTERLPEPEHVFDGTHRTSLTVEKVWHGPLAVGDTLGAVWPDLGCPAPARYPEGERRIVFLRPRGKDWTSVALSYGSKSTAAIDAYRRAVEAWFAIEEEDASALRQARYRWAVGLLDRAELRHEGRRLLAGSFWRGWRPGEFSREAAEEPAEVWRERLGQVSLLEYDAMPGFVLLHRSDRAVAKSWLLERFDAVWPRVDRDCVFDLCGFFVGLSGRSRGRGEPIQRVLLEHFFRDWDDESARADARARLKKELRAAIADWADQVSFPVDEASSR